MAKKKKNNRDQKKKVSKGFNVPAQSNSLKIQYLVTFALSILSTVLIFSGNLDLATLGFNVLIIPIAWIAVLEIRAKNYGLAICLILFSTFTFGIWPIFHSWNRYKRNKPAKVVVQPKKEVSSTETK